MLKLTNSGVTLTALLTLLTVGIYSTQYRNNAISHIHILGVVKQITNETQQREVDC